MSQEEILYTLKARVDILETMYAYCRHADNLDAASMVALFTDDCVANFVPGGDAHILRGKAALTKMLADALGGTITRQPPHQQRRTDLRNDGSSDPQLLHVFVAAVHRLPGHRRLPPVGPIRESFRAHAGWVADGPVTSAVRRRIRRRALGRTARPTVSATLRLALEQHPQSACPATGGLAAARPGQQKRSQGEPTVMRHPIHESRGAARARSDHARTLLLASSAALALAAAAPGARAADAAVDGAAWR